MTNHYPIMRGAEPFYFRGDSVGCLLIHGFTGTPKEMRWLGEQLVADGRTVLGVRLAGHGTSVADMSTTRWTDWCASVNDGYRQLRTECEKVFVMGLSLGGALALHLAAHENPDGLVVMATPLHVRDWRISVFRPFQRFITYWAKGASDMQDKAMRAAHLEYDYMPTACIVSLLDFFKVVAKELPRISAPTLLVYSQLDLTAPPAEMRFIHAHIASSDKRMITLARGGHIVCEDVERETTLAVVRKFVQNEYQFDKS